MDLPPPPQIPGQPPSAKPELPEEVRLRVRRIALIASFAIDGLLIAAAVWWFVLRDPS